MEPFNLETARLLVRPLSLDDLSDFHRYRSNPEVTKYQGFDVMIIEEAASFIRENALKSFGKSGEWVQFAIANKHTGVLIGDCAVRLDSNDPHMAEIGITISHLEQQKGFAKETLTALMTFLFDQLQIHRIVETVDAENLASVQLLKSCGFRQEGHFIENIFFKGKWGSEIQFALLKREWDERNARISIN